MSKMNEDIQKLFDPMVQEILIKRPEDIASFMLTWLQDYQKAATREIQEIEEDEEEVDNFSAEGNKMMDELIQKEEEV